MKAFAYARPTTESEAVALLSPEWGRTELLAGGTDLLSLMDERISTPELVVDIKGIAGLHALEQHIDGLLIGALATLDDLLESDLLAAYPSLTQAAEGVAAMQIRSRGTVGGELCQRPRCWYYRHGYGLLGLDGGRSLPAEGDNRYHANRGPAMFVSPSRLAPALIALGASARIVGPGPDQVDVVPLEYFFVTPRAEGQRENVLQPNQILTHVLVPPADGVRNATYEVLQMQGLDWPLASAAAALRIRGGVVREAQVVLGHVAPTPWVSSEAARALLGKPVTEETAAAAGQAAVARATPLSRNGYKVQLARTAVKRAVLRAAGLPEGGL
jgi:xanthine dehydrogenase YagS FAD-binding subunit